jgi:hypothetical protein
LGVPWYQLKRALIDRRAQSAERPSDIEDDGEFHFAILGPRATSDSGKPSTDARRYIDETTGPDKPRNYRNAVVLAVPSRDGVEAARNRIKDYLGWEEVRSQLREQLKGHCRKARRTPHQGFQGLVVEVAIVFLAREALPPRQAMRTGDADRRAADVINHV